MTSNESRREGRERGRVGGAEPGEGRGREGRRRERCGEQDRMGGGEVRGVERGAEKRETGWGGSFRGHTGTRSTTV